jgi:PAS domain S-box-containing protein
MSMPVTTSSHNQVAHPSLPSESEVWGAQILALLPSSDHYLTDLLVGRHRNIQIVSEAIALIEKARRHEPDIVVVDLPAQCDWAFDLVHRLKDDPGLRNVPVLALIGGRREEYLALLRTLPVDDCLAKPFDVEELFARVDRLLARRHLARANELLYDLIDFAQVMAIIFDAKGNVRAISPAAAKFLGRSSAEAPHLRYSDIFSADSASDFSQLVRAARSGRQVSGRRSRLVDFAGNELAVEIDVAPLPSSNGAVHVAFVFRDVSSRLQAEREAEEYTRLLQQAIEERTRRLVETQNQLIMSEKMAVVGQLAAGVAHEIRNPLNIIGMSAYYLGKVLGAQAGKVGEHLDIIQEEISRAQKIIENLLDFSRQSKVRREAVDLNALIHLTLSLLQKEIQRSDIRVETSLGDIPPCYANSDDLKQVLLNLILNARDAMPNGGVLTLKTWAELPDWVVCELHDTGVGISGADMPKIFNPFFTTKLERKGTGLGLAIVRSAIERNSGQVEVRSAVGQGTLFHIKLPTAK